MKRFEVGGLYGAYDSAVPGVKVLKRTAHTITVQVYDDTYENPYFGPAFTMRTKQYGNHEEATDSSVPRAWRECYTYSTRWQMLDFEIKES